MQRRVLPGGDSGAGRITRTDPTGQRDRDPVFPDLREDHHVDEADVLVDGATPLEYVYRHQCLRFRYDRWGKRNSVERVYLEVEQRICSSSNFLFQTESETTDKLLLGSSFAWIDLFEYDSPSLSRTLSVGTLPFSFGDFESPEAESGIGSNLCAVPPVASASDGPILQPNCKGSSRIRYRLTVSVRWSGGRIEPRTRQLHTQRGPYHVDRYPSPERPRSSLGRSRRNGL